MKNHAEDARIATVNTISKSAADIFVTETKHSNILLYEATSVPNSLTLTPDGTSKSLYVK